jgi:hypothetical protein
VLDHQDETGWLGPEVGTDKKRCLWGRYPFFLGATQMAEAYPDLTDRIVDSMYKFTKLANTMLKNNGEGVEPWGKVRWDEYAISLQWLFDYHPNGNEDLLLETMNLLKSTGESWVEAFSEAKFPTGPVDTTPLVWHGVNVAMGLKAMPVEYRFTKDQDTLNFASEAWDRLYKYHGRPSGVFAADEYLAGLEAARGSELCLVVENMFSGSYLYQVAGDLKYADRVERITYNALPATLTADMWSRQYLQQQNQIAAKRMSPNPFPTDGDYSNVFGLEPNYPCCTVNFPQGFPKFITNAFLTTSDSTSLIHLYLGPFSTKTTLAHENDVSVTVDTLYPFSDTLTTTINAAKDFTYMVRIPGWTEGGTISVNGAEAQAVNPDNGLQSVSVKAGETKIVLTVPAKITTENRPHGSIAVHRGPLHYALGLTRRTTVLSQNPQQPLAKDLQFDADEAWAYAIDPNTLVFHPNDVGSLPSPVFDSGLPPYAISASACPIQWGTAGDTYAASPPESPVACTGEKVNVTLTPYGSTKLRIGEFPVMDV